MAFFCAAGHRISTATSPNPNEYRLVSDAAAEQAVKDAGSLLLAFCTAYAGGLEQAQEWMRDMWGSDLAGVDIEEMTLDLANTLIIDVALGEQPSCIRCPECGRLHIQRRPSENEYDEYVPTDVPGASRGELDQ